MTALALTALAFASASAGASGASSDPYATYGGIGSSTPDGVHRYMGTREPLVRADDDHSRDLYDVDNGAPELVSIGPDGGNRDGVCFSNPPFVTESCDAYSRGASADGSRVYFQSESLRSSEPANGLYLYVREGTSLRLAPQIAETPDESVRITTDGNGCLSRQTASGSTVISTGPALGGGCARADLVDLADDGDSVLFTTSAALVASDTCCGDLYRWRPAGLELLSKGPTGQGGEALGYPSDRRFFRRRVATADGSRALFETTAKLIPQDTDTCLDVYESTPTGLILASGGSGPPCADAHFVDTSADLSRVAFETSEPLTPADTNDESDVYQWHGGSVSLVGVDSDGSAFPNGSKYLDESVDGSRVFFFSADRRPYPEDYGEGALYARSGATTATLNEGDPTWGPGLWVGASDDGTIAYFNSTAPLAPEDTDDGKTDLYRSVGGELELVSQGSGGQQTTQTSIAEGDTVSADGQRVVFRSLQELTWDDDDCGRTDFYEAVGSGVRLVSAAPNAPSIVHGPCSFDGPTAQFDLQPATVDGTLECRIDDGEFEPCSASYTTPDLEEGQHILYVRGGAGSAPESGVADRLFSIGAQPPPDTTPPDTSVSGPFFDDTPRLPRFDVSSTEGDGTLECSWDGEEFRPCDGPNPGSGFDRPTAPLNDGEHTFAARAIDGSGNVDPTPAEAAVTIAEDVPDPEPPVDPGTTAPTLDLGPTHLPRTLSALRRGVEVKGACAPECQVTASLSVNRRVARRLGLGSRMLLSRSEIWSGGSETSSGTVDLRLTKTLRRALRLYRGKAFEIRVLVEAERGDLATSQKLTSLIEVG